MPEQRIRAILTQRPGSGEMRVRKIPAWESRREGPTRLPAGTSDPFSARKGRSLPRRDLVQAWARFGATQSKRPAATHSPQPSTRCSPLPKHEPESARSTKVPRATLRRSSPQATSTSTAKDVRAPTDAPTAHPTKGNASELTSAPAPRAAAITASSSRQRRSAAKAPLAHSQGKRGFETLRATYQS